MKPSNNKTSSDEDSRIFASETFKEVKIWDCIVRTLPMTILIVIAVMYFLDWDTGVDIVLNLTLAVFSCLFVVWWYWVIYKIALTIKYMRQSYEKFSELREMLRNTKEDNSSDKSSHNC